MGLHLYGLEKDGDKIPFPSKEPRVDPETTNGYMISPVTVFPDIVRKDWTIE